MSAANPSRRAVLLGFAALIAGIQLQGLRRSCVNEAPFGSQSEFGGHFQTSSAQRRPFRSIELRIQIDDGVDGVAADAAEGVVPGEHQALHLRAVVAMGLVVGAFEGANQIAAG